MLQASVYKGHSASLPGGQAPGVFVVALRVQGPLCVMGSATLTGHAWLTFPSITVSQNHGG